MPRTVLGFDIGGANLKAADAAGRAMLRPFELWKNPGGLAEALRELIHDWPLPDQLAVTMTGELCDCFATKRQGVTAILDAVQTVAGSAQVRVWTTAGRFVDLSAAKAEPLRCAAANWLALATFAGRFAPTVSAVLLDIGSTTTDIVPLVDGRPTPRGRSDPERLACRELVYTGVRRTPVCALLGGDGAAEWFATTLDVYLLLGPTEESTTDHATADGRPATRLFARARLARMLCGDDDTVKGEEIEKLAKVVRLRQAQLLQRALETVVKTLPQRPETVLVSGSGEFLARLVLQQHTAVPAPRIVSVSERLGRTVSQAACAYAAAVLCAEEG